MTKSDLKTVLHLESLMPVEDMVKEALDDTRLQTFEFSDSLAAAAAG